MHRTRNPYLNWSLAIILFASLPPAHASFTREADLIYHKQDGFALTMEKVAPVEMRNGAAVILVMSGGWISNHNHTQPHDPEQLPDLFKPAAAELLSRGYTLFYVVHGTQPKFTIREIHEQIGAAVRHIGDHAVAYGVDSDRIGILGGSAGGHLALMQGTRGTAAPGQAAGEKPTGSQVQAVVAYFPPTDFLNYGSPGVFFDSVVRKAIPDGGNPFLQALDYFEYDAAAVRLTRVTDEKRLARHYRDIAPAYHVTPDAAPALLLHGDQDTLVPLQQSQLIIERFEAEQVPCRIFIKRGGGHGWEATAAESAMVADWYDVHLAL